jgi:4-methylaminobutanoate oxidase (formaldehyde-forming)
MIERADVVVIGAGVVGASVAWHLAQAGNSDVVLLERSKIGSGTTWHAAGNMETWRADPLLGDMVDYTVRLFPELEADSGVAFGWRQTGRVHFTADPRVMESYRAIPARARARGVEVELLDAGGVGEKLPILSIEGLKGGLWTPNDGRVDPTNLATAYARGATKRGVRLVEGAPVTRILVADGRVTGVETAQGPIRCEAVVLAGGLWSTSIARSCGVALPLVGAQHFYLLTKAIEGLSRDLPLFLSYDELLYGREDVGGLLLGVFDKNAIPVEAEDLPGDFSFALLDEDWEQIAPNLEILQRRFPLLATTGIRAHVNGPESFTPDGNMLLGELDEPSGLHLACGMNSNGIALAAGVGLLTAERVLGRPPSLDATRLDPGRFAGFQGGRRYRHARMSEIPTAVCVGEDAASPLRGIRRSPLHARHVADGAVLEAVAGHERPLWFTGNGSAAAELAAARGAVVRIDRSADAKLLLAGPDAGAMVRRLSGAVGLDRDDASVLAPMLDAWGGVVACPWAVRLDAASWLLLADPDGLGWLRRAVRALPSERVAVVDAGAQWAALDLVGPAAEALLARVADDAPLPMPGRARGAGLALGQGVIAHLAEAHWRLLVPADMAVHVDEALRREGAGPAGHLVDETLRILAGRPRAGIDATPVHGALAAGLVGSLELGRDFVGRAAVAGEGDSAPRARLVAARVEAAAIEPLEPVLRRGENVGWISSAGLAVDGRVPVLALVEGPLDGLETLAAGEKVGLCLVGPSGSRH